jgi:hypothetical protein
VIRKIAGKGIITTRAGIHHDETKQPKPCYSEDGTPAANAVLFNPNYVDVDTATGDLVFVDSYNNLVRPSS